MLANLVSSLGVHLVIEQWFKWKFGVIYLPMMHSFIFMFWPVNIVDIGNNGENAWNCFWLKMLETVFDQKSNLEFFVHKLWPKEK